MKRYILLITGLIITVGVALAPQAVQAGVDDFTFKDFEGHYYLSRDTEGRSMMRVVETFTAEFPDFDQNKGVVRAIPGEYDGHSVSVKVLSLKRNGTTEPIYRQYQSNDHWVVETGDDTYVRGNQTYELTYTVRDVTKDFGDHQELYWDTVGTGSSQSFGSVKGIVHLDASSRDLFTGKTTCYEGAEGSRAQCRVSQDGSTVTFTSQGKIGAYQNVTMVMEFKSESFAAHRVSVMDTIKQFGLPIGSLVTSLIGLVWAVRIRLSRRYEAKGRGIIVPQYLPPPGVSVLEASGIKGKTQAAIPAQLIDLAVRHKLRIIERPGSLLRKSEYSLEVLSIDNLGEDDKAVMQATTGLQVGATYTISPTDYAVGAILRKTRDASTKESALAKGYRHSPAGSKRPKKTATALLILGAMVPFGSLFILAFATGSGTLDNSLLTLFFVPFITWPIMFIGLALITTLKDPLTQKGVELKEYLEGLEMYMKVAEEERLRILQSPQGAEKTPINTDDKAQIVRLYERVLPYAVLFGIEKDWAKTLEIAYVDQTSTPDWYQGTGGAFNAAMLGSTIANFSRTASASFTPPSSSSSSGSGFSSGGGFSGGGGGGGSFGGR